MTEYTLDEFLQEVKDLMCLTQDEIDKSVLKMLGKDAQMDKMSYIFAKFYCML